MQEPLLLAFVKLSLGARLEMVAQEEQAEMAGQVVPEGHKHL